LLGVVSWAVDAEPGLCVDGGSAPVLPCSVVAVDDWADVVLPVPVADFVAEVSAGLDAVVFDEGPGFGLDSVSLPVLLVDFADGEVSAWATPAPDASARPRAKVAAPVPNHR